MIDVIHQFIQENQVFSGMIGTVLTGSVIWLFKGAPSLIWRGVRSYFVISINVHNSERQVFETFHAYINSVDIIKQTNRISFVTKKKNNFDRELIYSLSPGFHFLKINGKYCFVNFTRNEVGGSDGLNTAESITVFTYGINKTFIKDIMKKMDDIQNNGMADNIQVYMADDWGSWGHLSTKRKRRRETVILKNGMMEEISNDMDKFLSKEESYAEHGVPWRRGFLFYGVPGTGKTSTVHALASHFELPLYILNPNVYKDDSSFVNSIGQIPTKSILLIEDVDSFFKQREKDDGIKISFSSFLNAIDGMYAGHGRILIMTTNYLEDIDSALIRTGRIDKKFEFVKADEDMARRQIELFAGNTDDINDLIENALQNNMTSSDLQEQLLNRFDI